MLPAEKRLKTKGQLTEWLKQDLSKYGRGGVLDYFLISEKAILRRHIILLRKTEYYTNTKNKVLSIIYRVRLRKLQNRYSMQVPINSCEQGLYIMYVGPLLINENATVGRDCVFHMNSGLVAAGVTDGAPILGDGVIVGFGAAVVGEISIADNVAIGANAVVCKSVYESNIAIAGVPAKKVSNNGAKEWNKKHNK